MELNLKTITVQKEYEFIRSAFYKCCGFQPKFYDFPGGMPVSLSRRDMQHLKNYSVCEKTDGVRYMLFIYENAMYLVDRMMNFYIVQPQICIIPSELKKGTVLDGELVCTFDSKWLFMVFDVFSVANKIVKDVVHHEKRILEFGSYIRFMKHHTSSIFEIRLKQFFHVSEFKACSTHHYEYKTDGFIFTPLFRKIYNGTDKRTYKWKEPQDHTIDFELVKNENGVNTLYLWDKSSKIAIQEIEVCEHIQTEIQNLKHPIIVECKKSIYAENETQIWSILKYRNDKNRPNSMRTYFSTMEVIKDNITITDLLGL